jgi:hypothetical protein
MDKTIVETPVSTSSSDAKISYNRFDISARIEHIVFLVSFTVLGLTGLIQKFSSNQVADSIIYILGGIDQVRIIHHDDCERIPPPCYRLQGLCPASFLDDATRY